MNINQLLTEKNIGLVNFYTGQHISWYETTADEAGLLDMDDDGNTPDDYDCFGLSGFSDGDVHYFSADAEVTISDEYCVTITSESKRVFYFTLYRQVLTSELEGDNA